jgi:hypothetical protein
LPDIEELFAAPPSQIYRMVFMALFDPNAGQVGDVHARSWSSQERCPRGVACFLPRCMLSRRPLTRLNVVPTTAGLSSKRANQPVSLWAAL